VAKVDIVENKEATLFETEEEAKVNVVETK